MALSAQVKITVKPNPTVSTVSNQVICVEDNTNAITFSGTTGATFNWTNDNTSIGLNATGTGNIAAFQGINTGTTSQVANITVTPQLNNCFGTSETFTIMVYPKPAIQAGSDDEICEGSSVTLTATGAGTGGSYVWNPTITNGTSFIPTDTQTYTVTGTDENNCSNTAQVKITVKPNPTVSTVSNQVICVEDNTNAITFSGTTGSSTGNHSLLTQQQLIPLLEQMNSGVLTQHK